MRERFHDLSNDDLNRLKDRIHMAMEMALKQDLDPSISKKVAARLIYRNSWRDAVQATLTRSSDRMQSLARFFSPGKAAYNWSRFVCLNDNTYGIDKLVLELIQAYLGPVHSKQMQPENLGGVARVDLLERIAPAQVENILDRIHLSSEIRQGLRLVDFCESCSREITPFGRCLSSECDMHLMTQNKHGRPLQPFGPFYAEAHCNNGIELLDAAPVVEMLILETNLFDVMKNAVDEGNVLDPIFYDYTANFHELCQPLAKIMIRRDEFRSWLTDEWRHARSYSLER